MCEQHPQCASASPTGAPIPGSFDAVADPGGDRQVGPCPPHDLVAFVPDRILASLLLEDSVSGVLARAQESSVLDASVELADDAFVLPGEVGAGDEGSRSRR